MGAGFGYEHFVVRAEFFYRLRAFDEYGQLAFGARHYDGERREGYFARQRGVYAREYLRVGDYERWRLFERGERLFEPVRRAYEGAAAVVEDVADDLHLRQYEAALRGLDVLRRDEDDFRAGLVEVACERGGLEVRRRVFDDGGEQGGAACFVVRGYCREGHAEFRFELRAQRFGFVFREFVCFVERAYYCGFARAQLGEPLAFARGVARGVGGYDEDGEVCPVHHFFRAAYAQRAEVAFVVEAGGVDYRYRAERQQLHAFYDGVGGRARVLGDECGLLARDEVYEARLPGVAPSVECYVQPVRARRVCERHCARPPLLFRDGGLYCDAADFSEFACERAYFVGRAVEDDGYDGDAAFAVRDAEAAHYEAAEFVQRFVDFLRAVWIVDDYGGDADSAFLHLLIPPDIKRAFSSREKARLFLCRAFPCPRRFPRERNDVL